jgi:hypothetical protein
LSVPNGRTPSVLSVSTNSAATALIVPSPPPATTVLLLPRAALFAISTISAPLRARLICASMPFSAKKSTRVCRSSSLSLVPDAALIMMVSGNAKAVSCLIISIILF